jgi:hypothetical protein
MTTLQLNDAVTVPLAKAETSVEVALAQLPENSLQHIFAYGLRQILNDAMASAKTAAEAQGMAQKRLDNLLAGTLRAAGTREGDPVRREARKIATDLVTAKVKAKGFKPADVENFAELVNRAMDNEQVLAQAKLNVAAAKEIEIDIEL